jgi:predicted RNA-binding Zn ribbon-like protein
MRYHRWVPVLVQPMPIAALVALVNDWGTRPRQIGHRTQPPRSTLPGHAGATSRAQAIAVADRLHAVFATAEPAERAAAVNAMLAEADVRPELASTGDTMTAAWRVRRQKDALLASAALTLRDHLAAHPDRLGTCADRQCADVYVDASPAGHRRFCSVTCQNRTRVAAFRQQKRDAGVPPLAAPGRPPGRWSPRA